MAEDILYDQPEIATDGDPVKPDLLGLRAKLATQKGAADLLGIRAKLSSIVTPPPVPASSPFEMKYTDFGVNNLIPKAAPAPYIDSKNKIINPTPEQSHVDAVNSAKQTVENLWTTGGIDQTVKNHLTTERENNDYLSHINNQKIDATAINNPLIQKVKHQAIEQSITPDDIENHKFDSKNTAALLVQKANEIQNTNPKEANNLKATAYITNANKRADDSNVKLQMANYKGIQDGTLKYDPKTDRVYKPLDLGESIVHGYKERTNEYDLGHSLLFGSKEDNIKKIKEEINKRSKYDNPDMPLPAPGDIGHFVGDQGILTAKTIIPNLFDEVTLGASSEIGAGLNAEEMGARGYANSFVSNFARAKDQLKKENPNLSEKDIEDKAYDMAHHTAAGTGATDAAMGYFLSKGLHGDNGLSPSEALWSPEAKAAAATLPKETKNIVYKLGGGIKKYVKDVATTGVGNSSLAAGLQYAKNQGANEAGIKTDPYEGVGDTFGNMLMLHGAMAAITHAIGGAKDALLQGSVKVPDEDINKILNNSIQARALTPDQAQQTAQEIQNYKAVDAQIPATITDPKARIDIQNKIKEYNDLSTQLKGSENGSGKMHEAFHDDVKGRMEEIKNDINVLSKPPEEQVRLLTIKAKELDRQLQEDSEARKDGGKPKLEDRKPIQDELSKTNKWLKDVTDKVNSPDYKAEKIIEPHLDKIPGMLQDMAKQEPEQFLKFIADQSQGISENGEAVSGGDTRYALKEMGIPDKLVDQAIELFPSPKIESNEEANNAETKKVEIPEGAGETTGTAPSISVIRPEEMPKNEIITIKPQENAIRERSTEEEIPRPFSTGENSSESSEGVRSSQQGNEPTGENTEPTGQAQSETTDTGEENKRLSGIAQRVQESLGLREYEKGKGWSPQEAFAFGQAAIAHGVDPEKTVSDPNYANLTFGERLAVAQAHHADLVKDMNTAGDNFGTDSKQFDEAAKKVADYQKAIQPLKTESSKAFTAQQGEYDVDTNSFTAVSSKIKENTGQPLSESQSAHVKDLTDKNKQLQAKLDETESRLKAETDKQFSDKSSTNAPKGKLSIQLKNAASKLRATDEFDKFLKGWQGDKSAQMGGIDLGSYKEILANIYEGAAKVIEKGEDAIEFIKKAIDNIKEGVDKEMMLEDIRLVASKAGVDLEKQTPEQKNIVRLEKELEDLQNNIAKQKNPKRELSDKEKELKEQIKDEKERLGLVASKAEKPLTEKELQEQHEEQVKSLQKQFVDKKDNKFTPEESKSIWNYAKETYLDKGVNFRDMISRVSDDLGLTFEQVSNSIVTPKTKRISDVMWKHQYDLQKNRQATQRYIDSQGQNMAVRAFKKVSNLFREITVFGHGGVFIGTHAGMTLMDLPRAKYTLKAFFNANKFAYGKEAPYAIAMEGLKKRSNYELANRAGLRNNPDIINNDAEIIAPVLGRFSESGKRGFNAIKILRQDLFDSHYNSLSAAEKADPKARESIAKLVNNATGASNLDIPNWVNEVTFAGGMEASRWGKLTRNPAKATSTAIRALFNPDKVSIEDKVFAKVWAKRVGTELATYAGLLTANAALQNLATNDKDKQVNFADPTKSDWLKMKIGGTTFDFTSGMLSTLHFIEQLAYQSAFDEVKSKRQNELESAGKTIVKYGIGKLSPFYGDIAEAALRHDYMGNTVPFSDAKPFSKKYNHKLTWAEYASSKLPLPIAEGFKSFYESAHENGMSKDKIDHILTGLQYAAISGLTGFKGYKTSSSENSSKNGMGTAEATTAESAPVESLPPEMK